MSNIFCKMVKNCHTFKIREFKNRILLKLGQFGRKFYFLQHLWSYQIFLTGIGSLNSTVFFFSSFSIMRVILERIQNGIRDLRRIAQQERLFEEEYYINMFLCGEYSRHHEQSSSSKKDQKHVKSTVTPLPYFNS